METIIKKAIEGGYFDNFECRCDVYYGVCDNHKKSEHEIMFFDPLFWKSLGKAAGWEGYSPSDVTSGESEYMGDWVGNAMDFHEINLTEGWDKAVEYLTKII